MTAKLPKLKAPAGTCDTHMHVFGPRDLYPIVPTAVVQPPLAPVEAYRPIMARLGIERVVVVQPSGYGTDNRCTVDAV
jgi:D-galactarolactone isomerase